MHACLSLARSASLLDEDQACVLATTPHLHIHLVGLNGVAQAIRGVNEATEAPCS